MQVLETDMQCAGFCTESPLYLFSDVRTGVPQNGDCRTEIVEMIRHYSGAYAGVMLAVGIVGLVGWTMSFAICNIKGRKFKGKNNYNYAKYGMTKEN